MDTGEAIPIKPRLRDSEDDIDLEPRRTPLFTPKPKKRPCATANTSEKCEKFLLTRRHEPRPAAETAVRELEQMDAQAYAAHPLKIGMKAGR